MADLIDRQALRLMKTEECAGHSIEYAMGWKACIEWIRAMPSVHPEQKVGKWIAQKGVGYKCSECGGYALGNYILVAARTPYCPFCGAKMEEQDE